MKKLLYILCLVMTASSLQAQEMLTVDEAVAIALKNNYDVLMAGNAAEIAKANNTPGNAGMLPFADAVGNASYAYENVRSEASGGTATSYPHQQTVAYGAGVELAWSFLDGGKMFVTKDKLNEIQALGELQFQTQVQQTAYEVIAAYYDIVRQQQQLVAIEEVIKYNEERVKLAEAGIIAGSQIRTDLLQAQIDLNISSEDKIIQETAIKAAKKMLNRLLARDVSTPFEVTDKIECRNIVEKEEVREKLSSSNKNILVLQKQIEIAQLTLKENKRAYFPSIDVRGGYYFSKNSYTGGPSASSRVHGPEIMGTLRIPLYQAGEVKRKTNVAALDIEAAEYELDNTKLELQTELEDMFDEFEAQMNLLAIEEKNNNLTKQNMEISMQRLQLGQTTSLEVHQAQEFLVQSATRLVNFRYGLKIAEMRIKLLISEL